MCHICSVGLFRENLIRLALAISTFIAPLHLPMSNAAFKDVEIPRFLYKVTVLIRTNS